MKKGFSGKYCDWIYREGVKDGTHFAYTPCEPGFNFLSKCGSEVTPEEVCKLYTGSQCPICGRLIRMFLKDKGLKNADICEFSGDEH